MKILLIIPLITLRTNNNTGHNTNDGTTINNRNFVINWAFPDLTLLIQAIEVISPLPTSSASDFFIKSEIILLMD